MGGFIARIFAPVQELKADRTRYWHQVLMDENYGKADKAMRKLGRINHPLTLTACVSLLANNLPEVRSWAAAQIGIKKKYMEADEKLRNKTYNQLEKLLLSPEEHIRESAIEAIIQINDPAFAVRCISNLVGAKKQIYTDDISLIIRIIDVLDEHKAKTQDAEKILRWLLQQPEYERYREDVRRALGKE